MSKSHYCKCGKEVTEPRKHQCVECRIKAKDKALQLQLKRNKKWQANNHEKYIHAIRNWQNNHPERIKELNKQGNERRKRKKMEND